MIWTLQCRQWFATRYRLLMGFLPPNPPFLDPIEKFYSAWKWKVQDHQPHTQTILLATTDAACEAITADACRDWIRHSKRFFPDCIAKADICCDMDENLQTDRQEHQGVKEVKTANSPHNTACTVLPKGCFLCLHFSFCFFLIYMSFFWFVQQRHNLSKENYSTNGKSVNVNPVQSLAIHLPYTVMCNFALMKSISDIHKHATVTI